MNVIITGATKGIGRAIAVKMAAEGYNVAVCARNAADLEQLKLALKDAKGKVLTTIADCAKKDEILACCELFSQHFNTIDVLVNNVGIYMPSNILDESDENFELQQAVNLNASYYFSKFFGRMMRAQCKGHIFNICSVASKQALIEAGSYCVTKAAMYSLNNVLRKELAEHQVKVTAILPGSTLTSSWEGTTLPPEQFVQPEDIANTIYNLLSISKGANVDELIITPLKFTY
jgi:3-oxoacyl-[acyl-carrier protein] reductase